MIAARRRRSIWVAVALILAACLVIARSALELTTISAGRAGWMNGFDENSYFAFAHSLAVDGDLDLRNQYAFNAATMQPMAAKDFINLIEKSPLRPQNHFNIGTAIAAVPAVWMADQFARWMNDSSPTAINGFARMHVLAFIATNIALGMLALWVSFLVTRRFFGTTAAALGILATSTAGPFLYYLVISPGMAHMTSACAVALSVAAWLAWMRGLRGCESVVECNPRTHRIRTLLAGALAGAAVGFALSVRSTALPMGLLLAWPAMESTWRLLFAGKTSRTIARGTVAIVWTSTLLAGALMLLAHAPQFLAWKSLYGSWVANTQRFEMRFPPPYMHYILFHPRHGLFYWAPALLLAMVGLVHMAASRRGRALGRVLARVLLGVFAGYVVIYGSWHIWWLGVSFGHRGFVDLAVVFVIGFAALWHRLRCAVGRAVALRVGILVIFAAAAINVHLIICYRSGAIYVDGPLELRSLITNGDFVREQWGHEWDIISDFSPGARGSLWDAPALRRVNINGTFVTQ